MEQLAKHHLDYIYTYLGYKLFVQSKKTQLLVGRRFATMTRTLLSFGVLILSILIVLRTVQAEQIGRDALFQGQDLRLYELYETTSWPFLEDCYNSHNAYRRLRDVQELRMNRTVSFVLIFISNQFRIYLLR